METKKETKTETKQENKNVDKLSYADKYEKVSDMKPKDIVSERKGLIPRRCKSGELSDTELYLLGYLLQGAKIGYDKREGDNAKYPKCFALLPSGEVKGSIQERGLDHLVLESDLTRYGLIVDKTIAGLTVYSLPANSDKRDYIRRLIELHV